VCEDGPAAAEEFQGEIGVVGVEEEVGVVSVGVDPCGSADEVGAAEEGPGGEGGVVPGEGPLGGAGELLDGSEAEGADGGVGEDGVECEIEGGGVGECVVVEDEEDFCGGEASAGVEGIDAGVCVESEELRVWRAVEGEGDGGSGGVVDDDDFGVAGGGSGGEVGEEGREAVRPIVGDDDDGEWRIVPGHGSTVLDGDELVEE
jgi:hypothetical protein